MPLGTSRAFPRRLRFYSDVETTAPTAYRALPAPVRAGLLFRKVVAVRRGGYVAPPVRVHSSALGAGGCSSAESLPVDTVIYVVRGESDSIRNEQITAEAALGHASALLHLQRVQLVRALPALRPRSGHVP